VEGSIVVTVDSTLLDDVAAVKAKTDVLPAAPAATGDEMDLVAAPNADAITAIQAGLAVPGDEMDLVNAPNATAITAIQAGLATATDLATTDGKVDDVLEDTGTTLPALLGNLGAALVSKAVTFAAGESYTAFTVTGLVAVKVVGYVTTALSNVGATTSVGTATSAAGLIAATAGTAMQTEGQVWVDNAPSKFESLPATWTLIGNGEDIVVDGDATLAAGVVTLYCWYIPISAGAGVVAA
jgi:hypothetical protein